MTMSVLFVFKIVEFSIFSSNLNFQRNMYRFRRKFPYLFSLFCFTVVTIPATHADNPLEHLCLGSNELRAL